MKTAFFRRSAGRAGFHSPLRYLRPAAAALALGLCGAHCAGKGPPKPVSDAPIPDSPAVENRVEAMMARLSLEQKIDLIGGEDPMFIRALPLIGFPRLKMSDGPEGVRTWGPSTAYAGGIALAASWDPALARRMGVAMGGDARARGVHFLLGPGVDIYRAPFNGRNFEYFGEDPFLASRIAVGFIDGVQSRGVVATVKHFAANNSEYDRRNLSSDIDERTLREIYLPAFEAAVREAHAGAVMNSYNRLNGVYATQNSELDLQILKKEWGFDGILMSDWGATHAGPEAANAGLDLEMPHAVWMDRAHLLPAVRSGLVPVATIDDKVRRIFRTAIRFGFLDRGQKQAGAGLFSQHGREVALDTARSSIVLLKNDGDLLPFDSKRIRTVAVIGPDAWPPVSGGGGSSAVRPFVATSVLAGISELSGVRVRYVRGLPTVTDVFEHTAWARSVQQAGVRADEFDNPDFSGAPARTDYVPFVDQWRAEMWTPKAVTRRSVRWSARYIPYESGTYLVLAAAAGKDRYTLYINGDAVIERSRGEGQAPEFAEIPLTAGKTIDVRLDYLPDSDHDRAGFGIIPMDGLVSPEARKIAGSSDAAVVCVGFDPDSESEGFDRSFRLPWGQDALIAAVASANRRTVVTVTAGGGVDMRRWIDSVPALIDTWYPGQEGGTALAEILFGLRSPEGRLPASFERSWEDNPVHDHYYPDGASGGEFPRVKYAEGVFVGYRYYTSMHREPLFPFGFGLTYTTFAFSRFEAPREADSEIGAVLSLDVTNTGRREGAEVVQVYVGDPSARVPRPAKELKAFQKVRLQPGESRRLRFRLDRRAFAYWDSTAHDWRVDPGRFVFYVGDSSESTPLTADVTLTR